MDIGLQNASACWIWSPPRDTWSPVHQFHGEFCWIAFDPDNQHFFYVLAQVDHWQVLQKHRMSMRWRCNKCYPESEMKYVSFLDQTGFVGSSIPLEFFSKAKYSEKKNYIRICLDLNIYLFHRYPESILQSLQSSWQSLDTDGQILLVPGFLAPGFLWRFRQ